MANATGQVNVVAFGTASPRRYVFENVERTVTNFSKVDSKITRVTGFDGGIDEHRMGRSPLATGQVDVSLFLQADTYAEMTEKRDEIAAISSWGVLPLLMAPYDETKPMRFCWARCTNVSMPEDANMGTWHLQPVTLQFVVADPRWYSDSQLFWIGDGTELDAGSYLGEGRGGLVLSAATEDELEIAYTGKVPTPIVLIFDNITLAPGTTGPFTVVHMDEYDNILNEWTWNGTIGLNGQLHIDSGRLIFKTTTSGSPASAWADVTITKGTGFIWLQPGYNKLVISGTKEDVALFLYYSDAWAS